MMRYLLLLLLSVWVYPFEALSQTDTIQKHESLRHIIEQSTWDFHSRTFFMGTVNKGLLKDDYTLAQGAGIGMLTKPYKGFQFGVSGFFIFNMLSSNLHKPDSITGLMNRYEIGQYDITDWHNKSDMDRLEELYLRYGNKHFSVTLGRMNLNTPFMNPQDGRMRPTLEDGLWIATNTNKKLSASGGFIYKISPRSTLNWYSTAQSVGIYNQGLTTSGSKSDYKNNIKSAGFAILQFTYRPTVAWTINLWNGYFENVMNTAILELTHKTKLNSELILRHGAMVYRQDAVNYGGNSDRSKSYIDPGAHAEVFSVQQVLESSLMNWSLNYTRITGSGRYLMPREWGRDYFYTFLSRERNEGLADVHAFSTQVSVFALKKTIVTQLAYGYYKVPSVYEVRLNKYGMPSYHQFNMAATYKPGGWFKGIELRGLIVYKKNADKSIESIYKYLYNKADMWNFNFIIDFKL